MGHRPIRADGRLFLKGTMSLNYRCEKCGDQVSSGRPLYGHDAVCKKCAGPLIPELAPPHWTMGPFALALAGGAVSVLWLAAVFVYSFYTEGYDRWEHRDALLAVLIFLGIVATALLGLACIRLGALYGEFRDLRKDLRRSRAQN